MTLTRFDSEQWLTKYEHDCLYNLSDTSFQALKMKDLADLSDLHELVLDYGPIDGSKELREKIADLYHTDADQILPTLSDSQAVFLVLKALIRPIEADIIYGLQPDYSQYLEVAHDLGALPLSIVLDEKGKVDRERLNQVLPMWSPRALIFSNPNNPMGVSLDEEDLAWLIQCSEDYDFWLICDEVYQIPEKSILARLKRDHPEAKIVITSSLSKVFSAPGIRVGWIWGLKELIERIIELKDYYFICIGPLNDRLAQAVLDLSKETHARLLETIRQNKEIVKKWLEKTELISAAIPAGEGANCLLLHLPDAEDICFCKRLMEECSVLLVPGSYFGAQGSARLSLTTDAQILEQGLKRLSQFARKYYKDSI